MSPKKFVRRDPERYRREAAEIGRRIRKRRLELGMTQGQVASDRFSKAYISILEIGRTLPSMTSLNYIAERLGVTPDWLVAKEPDGEVVAMPARIRRAWFDDGRVYVALDDGRAIGLPVERAAKLRAASLDQLGAWTITDFGRSVTWPEIGVELRLDEFLGTRVLDESNIERPA